MKNNKTYSDKLNKFWQKNKPKKKSVKPEYADPVDALIYAEILEKLTPYSTDRCLKKLTSHFVDWNDLRVSRDEEIVEILGGDTTYDNDLASSLRQSLQAVFEKNDCLELGYIIELGKRKAKEELDDFKILSPFVIGYIMLFCLDAHSIPLNKHMADFMKANELADENTTPEKIQSFVERVISASDNLSFFETMLNLSKPSSSSKKMTKTAKK